MLDVSGGSAPIRVAVALLLASVAAFLLAPGAAVSKLSWDDLIAPLATGLPVTRGYVLSPPHRGEGHDVVWTARRDSGPAGPAARVEVHVVDRGQWSGVADTQSFTIAWEVLPSGALRVGTADDARAVSSVLADAIARNDTGFGSVDSIPLASEPPRPTIARMLERLAGTRGVLIGGAVALALVLLASVPGGAIAAGVCLFAVGGVLRAASLGVPFAHDQDVQRLLTGHLPLREIATGAGLEDRHPPLYFVVLHFVELLGQSETVVRAPAVVAGALVGPAVLLATASMCGRAGPAAALVAFAVTVSPELVARSREVSEIPLFALILIVAAASVVAAAREPRRVRLVTVALSQALALFTYYLAPFILAAHVVVLAWLRKLNRQLVTAVAIGVALGAPAVVLAVATLLRDRGARAVARTFPGLAWGQHTPLQMVSDMAHIGVEALGVPLLILMFAAVGTGVRRRLPAVLVPAAGATAAFAAIALLSPIARVQAYYVATVLPIAVLPLTVVAECASSRLRRVWVGVLALVTALATVPLLTRGCCLYLPDADAFMPRFASVIAHRPEHKIVVVAHYDKALLAYYLARADGRSINWDDMDEARSTHIEPLVLVHGLRADSEQTAAHRLDQIIEAGPTLVIERDAFLLPDVAERLSGCERLLQAPTARLVRCAPQPH